jgi:hypothetical protein
MMLIYTVNVILFDGEKNQSGKNLLTKSLNSNLEPE